MLTAIFTLIHVGVCIFLILVVLLQTGKGSDIAAAFGGSSQTAFGARGATTFLSKLTTGAAVLFMVTSMTLALVASGGSGSVVDSVVDDADPVAMDAEEPPAPEGALPPAESGGTAPPGGSGPADANGVDQDAGGAPDASADQDGEGSP